MTSTRQREPLEVDPKAPTEFAGGEMSLVEHLTELRSRLIRTLIGVVVGMSVAFAFADDIMLQLVEIVEPVPVQALAPTEEFTSILKVAFMAGIALSMPIIVYQAIAFISPGLTRRERGYVLRAIPFVALLFLSGVAFAYFVVLPSALRFLLGFGPREIQAELRLSYYISFVTNLILWVGVAFEMPVVVYTLIKTRIVSAAKLASWRRYAFLLILVAAAIITPTPDPVNLLLVAIPMYLLYELGIFLGRTM